ncbi:MAG: class I SAM-dependent methyltransferase [Candidatus Thorarchaeota archaeon]
MNSRNSSINDSLSRIETRNSYNSMSSWYDIFASFENKYRKIGLQLLQPYESQKILEIGFGTGKSLIKMIEKANEQIQISGLDLSDKMCYKASYLLRKKQYNSISNIICGDVTNIPLKNHFMDKIFLSFTLELFSKNDMQLVLEECSRILRDKGRICIISLSRRKVNAMVRIYEWFHKKWPKIIDCRPILADKILQQSNFTIITHVKKMMWGLPVDILLAEK